MERAVKISSLPSTHEAAKENSPRLMKRLTVGLATTVLVSGVLGLAGLGLAAGAAHANPPGCSQYSACWCPGQRMPAGGHVVGDWDSTACHDYHFSDEDYPPGPHMQAETGPAPRDPSCPPWATIFSGPAQCGGL
jgi:hypothetical protein